MRRGGRRVVDDPALDERPTPHRPRDEAQASWLRACADMDMARAGALLEQITGFSAADLSGRADLDRFVLKLVELLIPLPAQPKRESGRHKIDPLHVQFAYYHYKTRFLPEAQARRKGLGQPAREAALDATAAFIGRVLYWPISGQTLGDHFKKMGGKGARKNTHLRET